MWKEGDIFHKSLETRKGHPSFVFYEGPPSANGMPGIHHVIARSIKDIFCRYKTMKGYLVNRKAGWDTHGLPVELGVDKSLGITKEDIGKKISVADYNAACRRDVMKFTREWEDLTQKMGYWVDMENPYITYDNRYIETLWFLLTLFAGGGYGLEHARVEPTGVLPRREGHDLHGAVPDPGSEAGDGRVWRSLFPGVDHDPLDVAFQHGALRRPEYYLCSRADV